MKKYVAALVFASVLWGTAPVIFKLFAGVHSLYLLCIRILWSTIVAALAISLTHKWGEVKAALTDKKTRNTLFLAGAFITVNWAGFLWCVMNNRLLDSSLAYYINPIVVVLVGGLVFRERISIVRWGAIALAAAGVVYPMFVEGQIPWLAVLIALTFSVYGVIKKNVRVSGIVSVFIEMAFVLPFLICIAIFMEFQGTGAIATGVITPWYLIYMPLSGIITCAPLMLYSYGLQGTPLSLSGVLSFLTPTLQLTIGVVLYGEPMSGTKLVTFVLVFAAIALYLLGGGRSAAPAVEEILEEEIERACEAAVSGEGT